MTDLVAFDSGVLPPGDLAMLQAAGYSAADVKTLGDTLDASQAPATRKTYASAWRVFEQWCTERGCGPLPATPLDVAVFIATRSEAGASISRLEVTLAAIRDKHRHGRFDDPTKNVGVEQVMAGVRRLTGGRPKKQAHPLTTDQVRSMLGAQDRATLRGKQRAALLLIMYAGALRRSEAAGLVVADLAFKSEGVVLKLRSSKTDQNSVGALVGIARGVHPETDPVRAIHDWITAAGVSGDVPLFQQIKNDGRLSGKPLSGQAINDAIRAMASGAGLGDLPITGHSPRAGCCTTAAVEVPVDRLARHTRHRRIETLISAYIRPANILSDSSSSVLGL